MDFKNIKKELGLTNNDIAKMFGYSSGISFTNSARRKHIENGIEQIYKTIKLNESNQSKDSNDTFCETYVDEAN